MPKKIIEPEEELEDYDDASIEEELEALPSLPEPRVPRGRPIKRPVAKRMEPAPEPQLESKPIPHHPEKKRYTGFYQSAVSGLMDSETKEAIALSQGLETGTERDLIVKCHVATMDAIANIKEQIERIENSLGSMIEG